MKRKGFTLTEIIVAMVILATVMLGITRVFVSGSRYLLHSRSRMAGVEAGKYYLAPLQNDVRQDTWDQAGNNLAVGTRSGASVVLDGISYNPNYTVTDQSGLRKVKVTLDWTEPSSF